jgi:hypothetical protein
MTIEYAYTYTSSLYFRGKMAYAKRFAAPPAACGGEGVYVIAPGYGLVPPSWLIDPRKLKKLSEVPVDPDVTAYRAPLERHARGLVETLAADTRVVLLGSLLPGKYLQTLWPIFEEMLMVPKCFIGVGVRTPLQWGPLFLATAPRNGYPSRGTPAACRLEWSGVGLCGMRGTGEAFEEEAGPMSGRLTIPRDRDRVVLRTPRRDAGGTPDGPSPLRTAHSC